MTGRRGRVVIARIAERNRRNATLKKRKESLLKKAKELSLLCGSLTAMVIYSPGEREPTVFPEEQERAREAFSRFLDLPEWQSMAHSETAISFGRRRLRKMMQKAEYLKKKNQEMIAEYLLTKWADGEILLQDLDDEQKQILSKYAKAGKEELQSYMKGKTKDQELYEGDSYRAAVPKQLVFKEVPLEDWVPSGTHIPGLDASARNYAVAANDPPLLEQFVVDTNGDTHQLNNFSFVGGIRQQVPPPPSPSINDQLSPEMREYVETIFGQSTGASPNIDMSATAALPRSSSGGSSSSGSDDGSGSDDDEINWSQYIDFN